MTTDSTSTRTRPTHSIAEIYWRHCGNSWRACSSSPNWSAARMPTPRSASDFSAVAGAAPKMPPTSSTPATLASWHSPIFSAINSTPPTPHFDKIQQAKGYAAIDASQLFVRPQRLPANRCIQRSRCHRHRHSAVLPPTCIWKPWLPPESTSISKSRSRSMSLARSR